MSKKKDQNPKKKRILHQTPPKKENLKKKPLKKREFKKRKFKKKKVLKKKVKTKGVKTKGLKKTNPPKRGLKKGVSQRAKH
ncbi:hypothetical protein DDP44_06495 [Helicobacter pylori]|nr:hypothetical protein DDP44_06495 [Helicobacter pylori]